MFSVEGEKDLVAIETNHELLRGKSTELENLNEQILNNLLECDASENELSAEIASRMNKKLTEDLLRTWQCRGASGQGEGRLQSLMDFLRREIEQEERICLAIKGFNISDREEAVKARKDLCQRELQLLGIEINDEVGPVEVLIGSDFARESIQDSKYEPVTSLDLFVDAKDVLRLKTRISERKNVSDFRYPALLPSDHPVVTRFIHETRVKANHVGVQGLLSLFRERFWIVKVEELYSGRDGVHRLAPLRTGSGTVMRPIQRLYSLEATESKSRPKRTRSSFSNVPTDTYLEEGDKKPSKETFLGKRTRKVTLSIVRIVWSGLSWLTGIAVELWQQAAPGGWARFRGELRVFGCCGIHWAEQGSKVLYISATPLTELPPPIHGTPNLGTEALSNIRFLYLPTWQDLLKHLYSIHLHAHIAQVVIVQGLEHYCYLQGKPFNEMHTALIFASLMDATSVCGQRSNRPALLITSLDEQDVPSDKLNRVIDTFFLDVIWLIESENKFASSEREVQVSNLLMCPGQPRKTKLYMAHIHELGHVFESLNNKKYVGLEY
ncbi:unnamed protein product [Timema podura]|uniref:Uncharacterized protein n=1 Tax=Timema podura TaxID=61482 RepID=A0ABN7NGG2_TIMPD|nr:unnamed protein product [Timema podura]